MLNTTYSGYELTLFIQGSLIDKWASYKQFAPVAVESCGVLIGGYDAQSDEYLVAEVTTPLAADRRTYRSFTLQDKGHQQAVDVAFKASGGKHIYLGTWHTHPEPYPTPSGVDTRDWEACIQRNNNRQLFFVIVGTIETKVFVKINNKFESMTLLEGDSK